MNVSMFSGKRVLLFAVAFLCPLLALAHGDLHDRIVALTKEIEQSPTNAALYFQRGECHRNHQDWKEALADFDQVAKLDPSLKRIDFVRGRLWLDANDPAAALTPLDRYLASEPKDPEAFATRARVQVKLVHLRSAADDFTKAIQYSPGGNPEYYIERAQAVAALGANHVDEAIRGLDEGIRKMGPLVTFQLPAIDLEVSTKRYDAALARVDLIMAKLNRKESWFVRRAEILKKAGREKESKESYRAALDAINVLPPTHRRTRVTLELEEKIRGALEMTATADASRK